MQLVRLAILPVDHDAIESLPIIYNELRIIQGNVTIGFGQKIVTIRERPALTICATVQLRHKPKITESKYVVVPDSYYRELEGAIERVSNSFIIGSGKASRLSSPEPCIALQYDDEAERRFLKSAVGIKTPGAQIELGLAPFEFDVWKHWDALSDRENGVALLSDALKQSRAGRFRDVWRLFEHAFSKGGHSLIAPLYRFLLGSGMDYSESEIKLWAKLRDRMTHADQSKTVLLERDLNHPVNRTLQAAYDVLLNKLKWRSVDSERRELWYPGCGISAQPNMAFVYKGKALTMPLSLLDDFRAFPVELGLNIQEFPENWWPKPEPRKTVNLNGALFVEVKEPRTLTVEA